LLLTDGGEIDRRRPQMSGGSARDFSAASRGFRGEAKGEEGGVRGLFIAGLGVEEGLGFARNRDWTAGAMSGSGGTASRGGRKR
jgi:hypothetical protein